MVRLNRIFKRLQVWMYKLMSIAGILLVRNVNKTLQYGLEKLTRARTGLSSVAKSNAISVIFGYYQSLRQWSRGYTHKSTNACQVRRHFSPPAHISVPFHIPWCRVPNRPYIGVFTAIRFLSIHPILSLLSMPRERKLPSKMLYTYIMHALNNNVSV